MCIRDRVTEVTALVHSLDPEAFINIIKSEGIAGRFYEEPLEMCIRDSGT